MQKYLPVAWAAEVLGHSESNYLLHWSAARRYIYVETPKVACTTVKRLLQRDALGGQEPTGDVHDREASPLPQAERDLALFNEVLTDPQTLRFAFVRNPYARSLSCYLDKMVTNSWERKRLAPMLGLDPETPPSFEAFLAAVGRAAPDERDIHWATQAHLLNPRRFRYDFIGRFETFDSDLVHVFGALQIDWRYGGPGDVQHATGAADKLHLYMTPAAIDMIQQIYEDDFLQFGYGFGLRVISHYRPSDSGRL